MRTFWYIIAIYILTLTLESGVRSMVLFEPVETGCCTNTACEPTETSGTSCDYNAICNPFQTCSNCVPFTIEVNGLHISAIKINIPVCFEVHQVRPTEIAYDFWQPPKLVA